MRSAASIRRLSVAIAILAVGLSADPTTAAAAPSKAAAPKGKDTTPPMITCPSHLWGYTLSLDDGVAVTFRVTVTDDQDPAPKVTIFPPSGATFGIGTTAVTVTATDWKGNRSTATFAVTVETLPLPQSYKAYWTDDSGTPWFEWDITIGDDATVSGSGRQTRLLGMLGDGSTVALDLPAGCSGSGVVTGDLWADGTLDLDSSATYWTWNVGAYDGSGHPVLTEGSAEFVGGVYATLDSSRSARFTQPFLAGPTSRDDGNYVWIAVP